MHRFLCEPQNITSHQIEILDKEELHHLEDVLRIKVKDKVTILDGRGGEFLCKITHLDRSCVKLSIIEKRICEKDFKLTVACALPKKSKIDFIVEKLTEIGVDKIILLETERTEVKLKDSSKKIARLKKVSEAALKQSGNLFLPEITSMNFKDFLKLKKDENFDLALIPNLEEATQNIKDLLTSKALKNILVAIGPEGDFSKNEIDLAREAGFVSVALGENVLRVDTAAIVSAGFIKLHLVKHK